jgi:hypothetical protein
MKMLYDEQVGLIVDVWATVKTYIDKKERYDAASAFLRSLENHYEMDSVAEELLGNDATLDAVIKDLYTADDIVDDEDNYEEDNYDSDYDDE